MNCEYIISSKKTGSIDSYKKASSFLKESGFNQKLIQAELVHGKEVKIINSSFNKKIVQDTDGLITTDKSLALAVTVADCLPIYICSNKLHGIFHAGWKGLAKGIIGEAIEKVKSLNEKPENLSVFIGPSIHVCHFEVQKDLEKVFKDFSDCFQKRNSKTFLNLQKVAKTKLRNKNVENISISPKCTYCSEDLFSYRQDNKLNKMLAVILKNYA